MSSFPAARLCASARFQIAVRRTVRRFASPLRRGQAQDAPVQEVLDKFFGPRSAVRAYEADGAGDEQGGGRLLKTEGPCPGLNLVVREKAAKQIWNFQRTAKHLLGFCS